MLISLKENVDVNLDQIEFVEAITRAEQDIEAGVLFVTASEEFFVEVPSVEDARRVMEILRIAQRKGRSAKARPVLEQIREET